MASSPPKDDWKPPGFEGESTYSRRLFEDFLHGWERAAFASTRNRQHFDNTLTFRFADHFLESAVAVVMLTENGMLGPLRRELRFLVEHSVKVTAVDQRMGRAPLDERLAYLKSSRCGRH